MSRKPRPSTFSVVAADLERREWGVAVQSKFIAAGAVVPWAEANAGAVATQADANMSFGPQALARLRQGGAAEDVVRHLIASDPQKEVRQLALVDAQGRAAAFTGSKCNAWAGHVVGEGFSCQGNILLSQDVVHAMAKAMESTPGDLADRLLASLTSGQKMGGDRRGQQSAALLIVKPHGSYGHTHDRYIDIRVDDHPTPIEELKRIFALYDLSLLEREDPATLVPLDREVTVEVQGDLETLGYYFGARHGKWDPTTAQAFSKYLGISNFENKERKDGKVWPSVLSHLHREAEAARASTAHAQRPVYGALSMGPGKGAPGPSTPVRPGPAPPPSHVGHDHPEPAPRPKKKGK